jgi:ABC-type uncharacterized transport system auxiliary subunit
MPLREKNVNKTLLALLLVATLGACASAPPPPPDHFYRLQAVSASAAASKLAVRPFRAESLYAERPVVYVDAADPRQLKQYHYHLWLYPPAQLVQEHLAASLGLTSLPVDVMDAGGESLEGRVVRFDRVVSGKSSQAVVELELRRLNAAGVPLHSGVYRAEQTASDETMTAFVIAMEQALAKIYREFAAAPR